MYVYVHYVYAYQAGGDCAGVANVTAEHIHVRPYDDGEDWWPLVNDVAWFPKTLPWGPDRAVGSRNITMRGLVSEMGAHIFAAHRSAQKNKFVRNV